MTQPQESQDANIVVTLVHGTWARAAGWTKPDSMLSTFLHQDVKGVRAVHAFEWSGRNSHVARLEAAAKLAEHHENVLRANPSAKHYIIAHSHGGNVAMYALRWEEVSSTIAGIACLSTPFLHVRRFRFGSEDTRSAVGMWVFAGFASVLTSFSTLSVIYLKARVWPGDNLLDWLLSMGVPFLVFFFLASLGWGVTWNRYIFGVTSKDWIPPDPPTGTNILAIRSAGDEASGLLGFLHTLSYLSKTILNILYLGTRPFIALLRLPEYLDDIFDRFVLPINKLLSVASGIIAYGLFLVLLILVFSLSSLYGTYLLELTPYEITMIGSKLLHMLGVEKTLSHSLEWYREFSAFLFTPFENPDVIANWSWKKLSWWFVQILALVTVICTVVVVAVTTVTAVILYILRLPFGFFSVFSIYGPLSTEITAEASPSGACVMYLLPEPKSEYVGGYFDSSHYWSYEQKRTKKRALWHSDPYSHPDALLKIAEWIGG